MNAALDKVNTPHVFYTVKGGKHGGFSGEERAKIYAAIREFLTKNGIAMN